MCESCYQLLTDGVQPVVTPAMREAASLVAAVYEQPWGENGGPLHATIDDMNVGEDSFTDNSLAEQRSFIDHGYEQMCAKVDRPELGLPSPAEEGYDDTARDLCLKVLDALRALTVPERAWCVRWDTQWNHRWEEEN